MAQLAKVHPHLWFTDKVEEAANLYVSIFPDSEITRVTPMPADSPSGPAGSVIVVEFELFKQPFMAMQAGPLDPFNHAISFMVMCDHQAEIDHYWDNLISHGGTAEQCGWLRDRYGVAWQIVPKQLQEMMVDDDREAAKRAAEAVLRMVKLDLAELQRAFEG